jgi:TRAP-type C4-dicarboxylate transport system permease small subunit
MKFLINAIEIFNKIFTKIAEAIVIICIAGQAVVIFNTVVFRYFLNNPLTWGDEISVLLLVVITFFGCYLAMRHNKLARIELFIGRFNGKKKTLIYIISELMALVMLLVVLYFGVVLFLSPTSLRQKTPGLYIPLWIFYGMIPLTFFASIINTFSNIINYLKESKIQ